MNINVEIIGFTFFFFSRSGLSSSSILWSRQACRFWTLTARSVPTIRKTVRKPRHSPRTPDCSAKAPWRGRSLRIDTGAITECSVTSSTLSSTCKNTQWVWFSRSRTQLRNGVNNRSEIVPRRVYSYHDVEIQLNCGTGDRG